MSRLTELIAQIKDKDSQLGEDLESEIKAIPSRRSFGLNFEQHRPEAVDLHQRIVRVYDKVRILPERGSTSKGDQQLWIVKKITKFEDERFAYIEMINVEEPESREVYIEDLVVVAEFRDPIYPSLISTDKITRGDEKPFHTVINGENYHVLKTLTYTHRGKVDVIYIDPPYNTGSRDWKYNNDYVDKDDLYRHSKWLAFIERRLKVARELLNPEKAVMIVTIDEKEYLRLGLLLEQTFPEAKMQMVSSVINRASIIRVNEMCRNNEFIFFLWFGDAQLGALVPEDVEEEPVKWETLRRHSLAGKRGRKGTGACGPNQFYPIYVNSDTGFIQDIGDPLPVDMPIEDAPQLEGCVSVFPIRPNGTEINWGLIDDTFRVHWKAGYVRVGKYEPDKPQKYVISYVTGGKIASIEDGEAEITGRREDGSVEANYLVPKDNPVRTQWDFESHNASTQGTKLIKTMLNGREFPYAKSLYAVEDCLRLFVEENPDAVVLDFFAGSGTTAHAVMRLNQYYGGQRQCISVTNNEVSDEEQKELRKEHLRPGDPDWEKWGICDYITKPRMRSAITGVTPEGSPIKGVYRFIDESLIANGFKENAEFFTLEYESSIAVSHNLAFSRIAALLWMRAGSRGRRIDAISKKGWDIADTYGILFDLDNSSEFCKAIKKENCCIAYLVTNDDGRFQSVARRLPSSIEPVRLYEEYMKNFEFMDGDQ